MLGVVDVDWWMSSTFYRELLLFNWIAAYVSKVSNTCDTLTVFEGYGLTSTFRIYDSNILILLIELANEAVFKFLGVFPTSFLFSFGL